MDMAKIDESLKLTKFLVSISLEQVHAVLFHSNKISAYTSNIHCKNCYLSTEM